MIDLLHQAGMKLAMLALVLGIGLAIYQWGHAEGQHLAAGECARDKLQSAAAQTARADRLAHAAAEIAYKMGREQTQSIVEYRDRVRTVIQRAAAITREVPVYVSSCPTDPGPVVVPDAFRVRHDAAVDAGNLGAGIDAAPDPARTAGAGAPVALSAVDATVTANYATFGQTAARLNLCVSTLRQWDEAIRQWRVDSGR